MSPPGQTMKKTGRPVAEVFRENLPDMRVTNKSPGVRPVGIGETLHRALAKLLMRAAGEQAKTACWNLQLCAGLEAGIEGATHTVGQRRLERDRIRQQEEEEGEDVEEEEESGKVPERLNNLTIETADTEEETAEQLKVVLEIEVG